VESMGDYTLSVEVGDLQSGVYLATLRLKSDGKELLKTIRLVKGK
jgi:bifunctional DNase/RNase